MDRDTVKSRLTDIFRKTFADDTLELHDAMTADDVKGWELGESHQPDLGGGTGLQGAA